MVKMGDVMKPVFLPLIVALVVLSACKPDKPWSPDDETGFDPSAPSVSPSEPVVEKINIGDAEQGIWIEGRLVPESIPESAVNEEVENRRQRLAIVNVTLKRPLPEQLQAQYTVNLTRDFDEAPVVLRANVLVNDTVVGTILEVLGAKARKVKREITVDLLSAFDEVPDTFLAKVEGELVLMPEGTDESTIDPVSATSNSTSRAIQSNPIRVDVEPADAAASDASATAASETTGTETIDESVPDAVQEPAEAPQEPSGNAEPAPAP